MQFGEMKMGKKDAGEEIVGSQSSWMFTLLHVLNKTNQVAYINAYTKPKPPLAF